ncbi:uncharacterized protein V1518DRAFT_426011 [Limtongia smithiae]|uniref:uncharacterized protein n=1 Tax=Limtongia smithiae TaxID=1125753 RepID=UPI0034CEEEFF
MIFGPAMIPMVWFFGKMIYGEYFKRPPVWGGYEPDPLPEVTYYDSICSVKYPDILKACEDIKVYGDLAIMSCDPYRRRSNFLTGYFPKTPSGSVYLWDYVQDTEPVPIDFGPEFGELRPQGVYGVYLPNADGSKSEKVLRIFITNASRFNASVEVFDYTYATGSLTKVVSLQNPEILLDPVSVAPISSTKVFISNTLGYPYRPLLGALEFISGIPFGTLGYMDFTDLTNITSKSVGASTIPIGMEYVDDVLYVASFEYGLYGYKLYFPPPDVDPEEVKVNKSLGIMHFYPGERFYRTPYMPTHTSYSKELGGIVITALPSYWAEFKAWSSGRKAPSWAGLFVDRVNEDGGQLIVSDSVSAGLKVSDRKWQTIFWDKTGSHFSGLKSMAVENGRRFGVSPHEAGVLVCTTNGLEPVEVPAEPTVEIPLDFSQSKERQQQKDKLEHIYLVKDEL